MTWNQIAYHMHANDQKKAWIFFKLLILFIYLFIFLVGKHFLIFTKANQRPKGISNATRNYSLNVLNSSQSKIE